MAGLAVLASRAVEQQLRKRTGGGKEPGTRALVLSSHYTLSCLHATVVPGGAGRGGGGAGGGAGCLARPPAGLPRSRHPAPGPLLYRRSHIYLQPHYN